MSAPLITAEAFRRFAVKPDPVEWTGPLAAAATAFEISTPARVAHWMGQLYVESQGFTRFEENLHYSAERLRAVWPSHFPTDAIAQAVAGNPVLVAERAYGGRMGNDAKGDGWLYRGRGPIQITGKDGYREASEWAGVDLVATPARLLEPKIGALVAGGCWKAKGCNALADKADVEAITRAINGGLNGLEDRKRQTLRAQAIWR